MTKQARLPASLEQPKLADLRFDEVCFTVPWAMRVDRDGLCWLRSDFSRHEVPGGAVQMMVQRRDDGLHVWVPAGTTYSRENNPPNHNDLPVAGIHT